MTIDAAHQTASFPTTLQSLLALEKLGARLPAGLGRARRIARTLALALMAGLVGVTSLGCAVFGEEPDAFDRGLAHIERREYPQAIEELRSYAKDHPDDAVAWYNLGVAYQSNDQLDLASDAYRDALQVDPEHARAMVNLAAIHDEEGRPVQAGEWLRRAGRVEPSRAYPLYSLGYHYQRQGEYDKAQQAFTEALAREPENALANYRYAAFLKKLVRYNDAMEHYEAAIRAAPDDLVALVEGGDVAYAIANYSRAVALYERALAIRPELVTPMVNAAASYLELGRPRKAVRWAWSALDYDRENARASELLLRAYATLSQVERDRLQAMRSADNDQEGSAASASATDQ